MSTAMQLMTAEELLRMPRGDYRCELIRGELRKMPFEGAQHGRIAGNITFLLGDFVMKNRLGTALAGGTGFVLATNPDTVRAPDFAIVSQERVRRVVDPEGYFPGAPDLAVEVISPNDMYSEVEDKVFDWLDAGCRMVIVVNPSKRTVTVFRSRNDIVNLTEDDTLDGGEVVPGWSLAVKDIFAKP